MSLYNRRFSGIYISREGHTRSSLPDLLRHDPEDREYLDHDLDDDLHHSCGRPDLYILFKPLEKVFQADKKVHECILASTDILDGLKDGSDRGVAKPATQCQERCLPGGGHQFQQTPHSQVGISVVVVSESRSRVA